MTNEILSLQDKIKYLEKENQYLKSLLDGAGISYHTPAGIINRDLFDPEQGKSIMPRKITEHDANLFFGMFLGRTDVYAKRTVKKSMGETNYYTQCYNFYKTGCPRINGSKIRCQDCKRQAYKKLFESPGIANVQCLEEEREKITRYGNLLHAVMDYLVAERDDEVK